FLLAWRGLAGFCDPGLGWGRKNPKFSSDQTVPPLPTVLGHQNPFGSTKPTSDQPHQNWPSESASRMPLSPVGSKLHSLSWKTTTSLPPVGSMQSKSAFSIKNGNKVSCRWYWYRAASGS